ncbi:MAG TPA: hypothetical protein EYP41_04500 [Anaerolineae bacterium]|nr:hypothetical protein [Anaerolineae bacterium]
MSNHTDISTSKTSIWPTQVHPLSAFVTIVIDWLWFMVEAPATLSVVGLVALLPIMLVSMAICFVPVLLVQRFVSHDDWRASIAKGVVMGIVAGVPYPVIGTIFGGTLLGWAGLHKIEEVASKYFPNPK